MQSLLALGVRNVPVLARGTEYVFGQQIADVARFVGIEAAAPVPLEPSVLIARWITILHSAQRICRQLPADALARPATDARPGTLGDLAWHVFRIGDAFVECAEGRVRDWVTVSMEPPPGGVTDPTALCDYGDTVIARLEQWWQSLDVDSRMGRGPVATFQGDVSLHMFLERQTWHSAQHTRQLADVVERRGVQPAWPNRDSELAGLPLPKAVWN
ncbi:MAG: hypothetical protein H7125_12670 [Proteobacteria bacterium]|nr:hypothetical protein [Burkholderiales bacterium]